MPVKYPNNSTWVIANKDVYCSNSYCTGDPHIKVGQLCANHKNIWGTPNPSITGGYGCAKCAVKYWTEFEDIYKHLYSGGYSITSEIIDQIDQLADYVNKSAGTTTNIYGNTIKMPTIKSKPGLKPTSKAQESKSVSITSYGFKFDEIKKIYDNKHWDTRKTIRNPWGVKSLKGLTGMDEAIQKFILRCPLSTEFIDRIIYYARQYKPTFIGCHGGKHRSVAIAEIVADRLRKDGYTVEVVHRDLDKKG